MVASPPGKDGGVDILGRQRPTWLRRTKDLFMSKAGIFYRLVQEIGGVKAYYL